MQKGEKKAFVDHQRKIHEQLMREQKEFAALLNKVKTQGTSQGKAFSNSQSSQAPPQSGLEDTLKECYQLLSGHKNGADHQHHIKASHPVFVELERHIKEQNLSESSIDQLRPWSEKNRDKLKVL